MDTSWINLILEIGYDFTSSVEDCRNHLCCGCGSRELQPKDVAKIVGLMCRRHLSLLDCNVNLPTPANFWPGQQQGAGSSSSNASQSAQQQNSTSSNNNNDGSSESSSAASEKKDKKETTDATQTWKPEVFVQALKELAPQLNWKEVCMGKLYHFIIL